MLLVWLVLSVVAVAAVAFWFHVIDQSKHGRQVIHTALPIIALILAAVAAIELLAEAGAASQEQATESIQSLAVIVAIGAIVWAAIHSRGRPAS